MDVAPPLSAYGIAATPQSTVVGSTPTPSPSTPVPLLPTAGDSIWYEDVSVLPRRWTEFFPQPEQTAEERVNALVRLIVYATLAAYVYNREGRTLVLGLGAAAVVSLAFSHGVGGGRERYPGGPPQGPQPACQRPTADNPFANVLLTDLGKPPRPPACPYDSVKPEITDAFNTGLFRNATDVYSQENSQYQYYTMPVTTGIPDTTAFRNFLYGGMRSCKQDAAACPSRVF